jgi:hypothetical protein
MRAAVGKNAGWLVWQHFGWEHHLSFQANFFIRMVAILAL